MMRITYTHLIFSLQKYGGISRYFAEMAGRIAQFEDCDVSILAMAHCNAYLRESNGKLVVGTYLPRVPRTGRVRRFVNDQLTILHLKRNPPDVLHETYYARENLAPASTKVVLTVYDMIHERFPHSVPVSDKTREAKAQAVQRADRVICISNNTRADLVQLLPVDPAKICVVPLGCALGGRHQGTAQPALFGSYLLYVGDRSGYKNFGGLLRAIVASPALRDDVRLVCYGGGPFRREESALIRQLGLREESVIHLSGDDGLLARLYTHASALVYPSLYEGFGMPLLEAMSFGCPVACSNAGSLPEIAGDAAELFDPTDPGAMRAAIENVLSSSERAASLRTLGADRVKVFSWERCAAGTYEVYRSLL